MDPLSVVTIAGAAAQFAEQGAGVFITLFHYFRKVKNAPKLSKELQREAQLLSEVLDKLKDAFEATPMNIRSAAPKAFPDVVDEFANTMRDMSIRLDLAQSGKVTEMFKWPFTHKLNEEYMVRFRRYHAIFSLALETIQMCFSPYSFTHLDDKHNISWKVLHKSITGSRSLTKSLWVKSGKALLM